MARPMRTGLGSRMARFRRATTALIAMFTLAMETRLLLLGIVQLVGISRSIPIVNCLKKLRPWRECCERKACEREMSCSYIVRRNQDQTIDESNDFVVPMIPAAVFAILAINRLGAIHAVVFGGFSPPSLAQRMEASQPRVVMTASCGIEGAKGPIGYRQLIEGGVKRSSFKPEKIIIWQRDQLRWEPVVKENGERNWQRLVKSAKNRGLKADAVPIKSHEGIYIIYTSGRSA